MLLKYLDNKYEQDEQYFDYEDKKANIIKLKLEISKLHEKNNKLEFEKVKSFNLFINKINNL